MKRKASKKRARSGKNQKDVFDVPFEVPDILMGWWGFHLNGTTPLKYPWPPPPPLPMYLRPIAFVGRMYLNGFGAASSYFSVNHNGYVGEISLANRISGTYKVNPDGVTGSIEYPSSVSLPGGSTLNFVITNGRSELFLVSMKPALRERATPVGSPLIEPLPGVCLHGIAKRER